MFCPKCGKINEDTLEVCTGCGAPLHEEEVQEQKSGSKAKKVLASVIAIVVAAAIAVVVAVSCTGCKNSEYNGEEIENIAF